MGQRLKSATTTTVEHNSAAKSPIELSLSVFPTELGWFGLVGRGGMTCRLTIGHASADEARQSFASADSDDIWEFDRDDHDWNVSLRRRLQKLAQGYPDDLRDVEISLPELTDFQQRILTATRNIAYGETLSYAEVAAKAGSPRAARAVGNAMAANRIPVIIPCHRVISANGKLGGYKGGVQCKEWLLSHE